MEHNEIHRVARQFEQSHTPPIAAHEAAGVVAGAVRRFSEREDLRGEVEFLPEQPVGIIDDIKNFHEKFINKFKKTPDTPRYFIFEDEEYEAFDLNDDEAFEGEMEPLDDDTDVVIEGDARQPEEVIAYLEGTLRQIRDAIKHKGLDALREEQLHSEKDILPSDLLEDALTDAEQYLSVAEAPAEAVAVLMAKAYELIKLNAEIRQQESKVVSQEARNFFLHTLEPATIMAVRHLEDDDLKHGYLLLRNAALLHTSQDNLDDRNLVAYCFGYEDAISMYEAVKKPGALDGFTPWDEIQAIESMTTHSDGEIRMRAGGFFESRGLSGHHMSRIIQGFDGRAREHTGDEEEGAKPNSLDSELVAMELRRFEEAEQRIGIDNIMLLYKELGIVNIGELSEAQQERMVRFAHGDEALLEELRTHDVCVIVRDATSDYNGALAGTYYSFETKDDSALIFEISDLVVDNQFKKVYASLQERGIHPAAYVFAGHGKPGNISFGNGTITAFKSNFEISSLPLPAKNETPSEELFRAFFSLMKPGEDGTRNIIFCSCSQGSLYDERDSTLTQAARVANEMVPGGDIHVYGNEHENNIRNMHGAGTIFDSFSHGKVQSPENDQNMTEVHVGRYGGIYTTNTNPAVHLPMFNRIGISNSTLRTSYDAVTPDGGVMKGEELRRTSPDQQLAITAALELMSEEKEKPSWVNL